MRYETRLNLTRATPDEIKDVVGVLYKCGFDIYRSCTSDEEDKEILCVTLYDDDVHEIKED